MARWADSTGMMSWTKVIFSERIRSMAGKLSMNFSIFSATQQKLIFFSFSLSSPLDLKLSFRSETENCLSLPLSLAFSLYVSVCGLSALFRGFHFRVFAFLLANCH